MMERRNGGMFCFQETRWRVNKVKQLGRRWKLNRIYANEQVRNAVGMVLSNGLKESLTR